jgi:hypothetical protein
MEVRFKRCGRHLQASILQILHSRPEDASTFHRGAQLDEQSHHDGHAIRAPGATGELPAPFDGAPSPVDCGWMVSGLSGQLNTAALLVLVLMGTETASILLMVMMLLMFLLHCAAGVAHEVLRSAYHAQRHVPVSRDNLFEMKLSGIKDPLPLQDEA